MIERVEFTNYKVLRHAELPLSQFTLLVGPNGSGKSTALEALGCVAAQSRLPGQTERFISGGSRGDAHYAVVELHWSSPNDGTTTRAAWYRDGRRTEWEHIGQALERGEDQRLRLALREMPVYTLGATEIASPVQLTPEAQLAPNGRGLANVLDRLRDQAPERFRTLNDELARWIPEFDQVIFDTPSAGFRAFGLRVRESGQLIEAGDLSHGTLLALAILTIAYLPEPPAIIGLEEPDRGIHPRLLRHLRDAMYRLSYPADFGEDRDPVQVIATTHSPYLLDLFRDHPEEIVIAEKRGTEATFQRLSDRKDMEEILADVHLGDAWYSGILGGVPAEE